MIVTHGVGEGTKVGKCYKGLVSEPRKNTGDSGWEGLYHIGEVNNHDLPRIRPNE